MTGTADKQKRQLCSDPLEGDGEASVCLTEKKIYLLNHAVSVLDSLLIADDAAVQLALCRPKDENIFFGRSWYAVQGPIECR